jgi:hypothetical protein
VVVVVVVVDWVVVPVSEFTFTTALPLVAPPALTPAEPVTPALALSVAAEAGSAIASAAMSASEEVIRVCLVMFQDKVMFGKCALVPSIRKPSEGFMKKSPSFSI